MCEKSSHFSATISISAAHTFRTTHFFFVFDAAICPSRFSQFKISLGKHQIQLLNVETRKREGE